jgi:hypothetical protein
MNGYRGDNGLNRKDPESRINLLHTKKILQEWNERGKSNLKNTAMCMMLFNRRDGMINILCILMPE